MKPRYFIKYDARINTITGCQRATLILSTLEYWFRTKSDGFYKFIEPCSHRLYKHGDSWTEHLGCDRKTFSSSFKKIGVKYASRRAFEAAQDKFQEKMYASYYDRYTNQTFFVRNHDLVNKLLDTLVPAIKNKPKPQEKVKPTLPHPSSLGPLQNGNSSRSYKEAKNTSFDFSLEKSHAGNEVLKKMVEIWIAVVDPNENSIELTNRRIAFLKQAFKDKFENCLEKWRKFCERIATSKFLMGEIKSTFRATLDWVLKFESIQKILDGHYGIGDRIVPIKQPSEKDVSQEINKLPEPETIKHFRRISLKTVGAANYISWFKALSIEHREGGELALITSSRWIADWFDNNYSSYLQAIVNQSGEEVSSLIILAPEETKGRIFKRKRAGGKAIEENSPELQPKPTLAQLEKMLLEEQPKAHLLQENMNLTKTLQTKLQQSIPAQRFPGWLSQMEVKEIKEDGTLIVTFEDSLKVNFCQLSYSQDILYSARELWENVKRLVIQELSDTFLGPLTNESSKEKEELKVQQFIYPILAHHPFSQVSRAGGLHETS